MPSIQSKQSYLCYVLAQSNVRGASKCGAEVECCDVGHDHQAGEGNEGYIGSVGDLPTANDEETLHYGADSSVEEELGPAKLRRFSGGVTAT